MNDLKNLFLLRPDVVYLNHGAVGACPKQVFEKYQYWQLELERDPVSFFNITSRTKMREAAERLGAFVNADPEDMLFFTNVTTVMNTVFRSLSLKPGDEILCTGHEYGAIKLAAEYANKKTGAIVNQKLIPLPLVSHEKLVEDIWAGVTDRTRVILIDHISAPTAMIFPVAEIARRARKAGIITVVDGAHAPGQIPVDLKALDVDFYAGNCHKWLMSPKGAAFLYVRRDRHQIMEPLVVSWGVLANHFQGVSNFAATFEDQGVRDPSAFLSVTECLEFRKKHDWQAVQDSCHQLLRYAQKELLDIPGIEQVTPRDPCWFYQMAAFRLPNCDPKAFHDRLFNEFRIQIPIYPWHEHTCMRLSIQGYNTQEDVDALLKALKKVLKK